MKLKLVAILTTIALLCSIALPPLCVSAQPTVTQGDINADGKINITDAVSIYYHVLGSLSLTAEQLLLAESNGDGKINIADALYWYYTVNGITQPPPTTAPVSTTTTIPATVPTTEPTTTAAVVTTTTATEATTTTEVTTTVPTSSTLAPTQATALRGIDVSYAQSTIDWEAVKKSDIDFAIIRCGYGQDEEGQQDLLWEQNAAECERLGIPYGSYFFCYARNEAEARGEAQHAIRLLEGKNLTYPVFYDMEYSSWQGNLSAATYAAIATVWCEELKAAGYTVGVYANLDWWRNRLTDPCFDKWYRWVAQYNETCDYTGVFHLWQYSDNGTVEGIDTNRVDMSYCYVDFESLAPSTTVTTASTTTTTGATLLPTQATAVLGVNVSSMQGTIDWAAAQQSDIDFAIIRCGYGQDEPGQDDAKWEQNTAACEKVGMPYGASFFCYARNEAEARGEAQHALRLLEGKNLTYPVFYDMEYSSWQGNLTADQYAAIATVFCQALEEAGYQVGVYATLDWWRNRLTDPCFKTWYRWVAQYNTTCDYNGTVHMWQYENSATVSGISANTVPLNRCYVAFE